MGFSNLTGGSKEASNGAVLAETGSGTLTSLASVDHFVFLGEVVTDPFAVVEAGTQCVHLSIQISQIQANPAQHILLIIWTLRLVPYCRKYQVVALFTFSFR